MIALAVILTLLVFSASIAVPILFQPPYYIQIDAPRLPKRTEWPEEVIRETYDEMPDSCVFEAPFGIGELSWSELGRNHFVGVRVFFRADFLVLNVTAVSTVLLLLLRRLRRLEFCRPTGRGPGFWAGVPAAGLILAMGALMVLDFGRVFIVFRAIFFPDRGNWLSNPATDEIILITSERFLLNYALLIGAVLLPACEVLIAGDLLSVYRRTKKAVLPR